MRLDGGSQYSFSPVALNGIPKRFAGRETNPDLLKLVRQVE